MQRILRTWGWRACVRWSGWTPSAGHWGNTSGQVRGWRRLRRPLLYAFQHPLTKYAWECQDLGAGWCITLLHAHSTDHCHSARQSQPRRRRQSRAARWFKAVMMRAWGRIPEGASLRIPGTGGGSVCTCCTPFRNLSYAPGPMGVPGPWFGVCRGCHLPIFVFH
jgi:hypothetical protein